MPGRVGTTDKNVWLPLKRFKIQFFRKKFEKSLVVSEKVCTFAPAIRKTDGSVAQLNRASDYGSEGCGFESRRNHKKQRIASKVYFSSLFFCFL